jgi:hypothetical protein
VLPSLGQHCPPGTFDELFEPMGYCQGFSGSNWSLIEVNGTAADGADVLFHHSTGLMRQLHISSSNQGQCAY